MPAELWTIMKKIIQQQNLNFWQSFGNILFSTIFIWCQVWDFIRSSTFEWLSVKSQSRELNPRLYRWIIKLSEFNITVSYIKGRDNHVVDFLSRVDSGFGQINYVDDSNDFGSLYNNTIGDLATIHSQVDIGNGHKKIYINSDSLNENLDNILLRNIEKNPLGIKDRISKAIELYNNTYHSVIWSRPKDVEHGNCDKARIFNLMAECKKETIRHYVIRSNRNLDWMNWKMYIIQMSKERTSTMVLSMWTYIENN